MTQARRLLAIGLSLALLGEAASAQAIGGIAAPPPPTEPLVFDTDKGQIRVVPVANGLSHPWGMAFRDNGDILITERNAGTLRVIRDGELLAQDIPGVPEVFERRPRAGLMDIALHPNDDRIVFLTYSKAIELDGVEGMTVALARGLLDGDALTDVRDIFVADGLDTGVAASALLFMPDGTLMMSVGGAYVFGGTGELAQDPSSHFGKLLRFNTDGTPAADNPFLDDADYRPEIYTLGHRNQMGLAFHPDTGELWATENGPQGGDEVNIIRAGANYGWPLASYSRGYNGSWITETPWRGDFKSAMTLWWPSVAPTRLAFYTGDHFPDWQGNLFVGSLMVGRMLGTGHLERIVFNARGEELGREMLLTELHQRIRDVQQGPDGYLYVLTDAEDAVLLRIEPVS